MDFQEHLTNRSRHNSSMNALMGLIMWETDVGLNEFNAEVEDEFTHEILKSLSFEPLSHQLLRPDNWKVARPALALSTDIDAFGVLFIDVTPLHKEDWGSQSVQPFKDFCAFFDAKSGSKLRVFELNLRRILRDDGVAPEREVEYGRERYGYKNKETSTGARQRSIVFSVYEYIVGLLSEYFACKVIKGLVCLGADRELIIRDVEVIEKEVEYANLLGHEGALWHPDLLALCEPFNIKASQAIALYRDRLKGLDEWDMKRMWDQVTGTKQQFRNGRRRLKTESWYKVLDVLKVVADPDTWTPLSSEHKATLDPFFKAIWQEHGADGFAQAVSERYLVDIDFVYDFIDDHFPEFSMEIPHSPARLLKSMSRLQEKEVVNSVLLKALDKQCVDFAKSQWDSLPSKGLVKLRVLLSALKLTRDDYKQRCGEAAPILCAWIEEKEVECSKPKSKKTHAAK